REHPQEQQEEWEPDQLDPAGDPDPRRPAGHGGDATPRVVPIRPPDWDLIAFDGPLALDPSAFTRLKPDERFATVPAMSPPVPHRRPARTHRRHLERERRVRRLAVLLAILVVALVTLLVSAFGGDGKAVPAPTPASAARLLPAGPPAPEIVAGGRRTRGHRRVRTGRRHFARDRRRRHRRSHVRLAHRHPTDGCTVARRLGVTRPDRPGARRRLAALGGCDEARLGGRLHARG